MDTSWPDRMVSVEHAAELDAWFRAGEPVPAKPTDKPRVVGFSTPVSHTGRVSIHDWYLLHMKNDAEREKYLAWLRDQGFA